MKNFIAFTLMLLSMTASAQNFGTIVLSIKTGNDGLREGNDAWISFVKTDGTMTSEKNFADIGRRQGAFNSNIGYVLRVPLGATIDLKDVASIVIRHDGSPRALNPFDTYDTWDVESIEISVKFDNGGRKIYDSKQTRAKLVQFNDRVRTLTIQRSQLIQEALRVEPEPNPIELQPTIAKPEDPKVATQPASRIEVRSTPAQPEPKVIHQPTKVILTPTTVKPEAPKPASRG
jgi:hypothetical protein